jgi:hypothetical protein
VHTFVNEDRAAALCKLTQTVGRTCIVEFVVEQIDVELEIVELRSQQPGKLSQYHVIREAIRPDAQHGERG